MWSFWVEFPVACRWYEVESKGGDTFASLKKTPWAASGREFLYRNSKSPFKIFHQPAGNTTSLVINLPIFFYDGHRKKVQDYPANDIKERHVNFRRTLARPEAFDEMAEWISRHLVVYLLSRTAIELKQFRMTSISQFVSKMSKQYHKKVSENFCNMVFRVTYTFLFHKKEQISLLALRNYFLRIDSKFEVRIWFSKKNWNTSSEQR